MNKYLITLSAFVLAWLPAKAAIGDGQTDSIASIVEAINQSGTITVRQSPVLDSLVARHSVPQVDEQGVRTVVAPTTRSGYRVQVFDDNNPRFAASQAKARQAQMESAFPQYRTYISFNSPYWRVKLGDFRTRAEAESVLEEIRSAYPSLSGYLRIVRDKINIE